MPLVADVLFRIGVGLVRMDRRVRASGLAVVVVQSKSPAHAACISTAGRQSGYVRARVHRGLRAAGDPGTGGLHPPATDEEFSFTVCHLLRAAGRADWRVRDPEKHVALGGAVRSTGAGHGAGAGEHVPGKPARGVAWVEQWVE